MWRKITCLIAVSLALGPAPPGRGQPPPATESLAERLRWVEFHIVLGRLAALNPRFPHNRTQSADDAGVGVRQSMSLSVRGGVPSIHYELVDQEQQLTVDFIDGDHVTIRREPRGDAPTGGLHFTQAPKSGLTMVVDLPDQRREYSAATLWHMMLAEPEACREHLVPILELLRPNWQLLDKAKQVEEGLFRAARSHRGPARSLLRELVGQLASTDFRQRQAADRELRSYGQAIIAFFDELDERELDAEQRLRISRIREALAVQEGDTPMRVAARLADDQRIWLTLMGDEDPSRRGLAASQLERLWGRPIDFDPQASESQRRAQIARLRAQLAAE
jgi:hypothetical protein